MSIIKLTKLFFVPFILVYCASAYAGMGWNVHFENNSNKTIVISYKDHSCFYLNDFEKPIELLPNSSRDLYAEEKNSGTTCNATFYRIHTLNLTAQVVGAEFSEIDTFPITFVGDFSNAPLRPFPGISDPKLTLSAGNQKDTWTGTISASKSSVKGVVVFGHDGKPFYVMVHKIY